MSKKIYLIDWNSFVYRMFYAVPEFITKKWIYVNAVYWIANFILGLKYKDKPDFIYFIRDAKWKTFRDEIYSLYKAQRDKTPDDLRSQFWLINQVIESMKISVIEIPWFEADDVIWTLATNLSKNPENDIYILSWDKDLFSLVRENVKIYDTMKKKIFGIEETIEKFWIAPDKIIDYLAIVWDKADNIPGIEWFWVKKALEVIQKYWSVEELYNHTDDFWGKLQEKLINSRENAFLSKKLATIILDIDLSHIKPEDHFFNWDEILNDESIKLMNELEFFSITWGKNESKTFDNLWISVTEVTNKKILDDLFEKIKKEEVVAFDTETTWTNALLADLVWVSFLIWEHDWYYINMAHEWEKVDKKDFKDFIEKVLELDITLVAHNAKYDLQILNRFLKSEMETKKQDNKITQKSLF